MVEEKKYHIKKHLESFEREQIETFVKYMDTSSDAKKSRILGTFSCFTLQKDKEQRK